MEAMGQISSAETNMKLATIAAATLILGSAGVVAPPVHATELRMHVSARENCVNADLGSTVPIRPFPRLVFPKPGLWVARLENYTAKGGPQGQKFHDGVLLIYGVGSGESRGASTPSLTPARPILLDVPVVEDVKGFFVDGGCGDNSGGTDIVFTRIN